MITQAHFGENLRTNNWTRVLALANALRESDCGMAVRPCDPFDWWEKHPVVSQFLDLRDREISAAIQVANSI